MLNLNERYHITFPTDFKDLTDIYVVIAVYTYSQLLENDIDLFALLYDLVGKSEEEMVSQLSNYREDTFYLLEQANGSNNVCVPSSMVAAANPNVKQYYHTMLGVNLGAFDDPTTVYPITDVVINTLRDRLGNPDQSSTAIANASALSDLLDLSAIIRVADKEWMLESEYENIVARRKAARVKAEELGGRSHTNYCTMYLDALAQRDDALRRVAILEAKLVQLLENP